MLFLIIIKFILSTIVLIVFISIFINTWNFKGNIQSIIIVLFTLYLCYLQPLTFKKYIPSDTQISKYMIYSIRFPIRYLVLATYITAYIKQISRITIVLSSFIVATQLTLQVLLLLLFAYISSSIFVHVVVLYISNKKLVRHIPLSVISYLVIFLGTFLLLTNQIQVIRFDIILWVISTVLLIVSIYLYPKITDQKLMLLMKGELRRRTDALSNIKVAQREAITMKKEDMVVSLETTDKVGFHQFNALFFIRHRSFLRKPIRIMSIILLSVLALCIVISMFVEGANSFFHGFFTNRLFWVTYIVSFMNRGEILCRAMYFNCDESMLQYRFYRKSSNLLRMFCYRLGYLASYHSILGFIMSFGLVVLMLISGYQATWYMYIAVIVSVLMTNVFFCIHSLVLYYLLQPYTSELNQASKLYVLINMATYIIIYLLSQNSFNISTFAFGTILVCMIYAVIATILIYKLSPKTFRIK